jgi:hypothetical protein
MIWNGGNASHPTISPSFVNHDVATSWSSLLRPSLGRELKLDGTLLTTLGISDFNFWWWRRGVYLR